MEYPDQKSVAFVSEFCMLTGLEPNSMTYFQFFKTIRWRGIRPTIEWYLWTVGFAVLSATTGTSRPAWKNVLYTELGWLGFCLLCLIMGLHIAYLKEKRKIKSVTDARPPLV